jgi:AraC-like DNA-binding protein
VPGSASSTERYDDLFELFEAFDYSNFPNFEYFAEFFDYEPKTLQRRLSQQGSSFSELVDRARRSQAESMLRQGTLKIQKISDALGYRNPSAFDRAFTRWRGISPKRWQSRLGA